MEASEEREFGNNPVFIKFEPIELSIEYDGPKQIGEQQQSFEEVSGASTSDGTGGESPGVLKTEPGGKAMPLIYDVDVCEADIKEESAAQDDAPCDLGSGTSITHHTPDERSHTVPELSSLSSHNLLEVNSAALQKNLYQYSHEENTTNQDANLGYMYSSYVELERCPTVSSDLKQATSHSGESLNYSKEVKNLTNIYTGEKLHTFNLSRPMTVGTNKKSHACQECGKTFTKASKLSVHMLIHTGEKPHTCQECGKSFRLPSSLRNHMTIHSTEKPHTCQHCGKCFSHSSSFRRHMIVHTGEKPHTCQDCGKCFSHSGSLRRHLIIHTGEKPNTCQECGKSFNFLGNFQIHMTLHSGEKPHLCKECGKSFSHPINLRRHMIIHTSEKPHTCQVCGKSFALPSYLRRHMIFHIGEKQHVCQECGKSLTTLGNLRRHMASHC